MATYTAEINWSRGDQDFLAGHYSRRHLIRFDAGIDLPGSSSPNIVPEPWSDPKAVDPEEAFVASLSSCHMLLFLAVAARRRFVVDAYVDQAEGLLAKDADGRMAMTVVTLRPRAHFSGDRLPEPHEIERMHAMAHEQCFIANSVRTELRCQPRFGPD